MHISLASSPKFNLKGRHLTSASKLKSADWVAGLGPNTGLSLESEVDVSVDVDSYLLHLNPDGIGYHRQE